MPGDLLPPKAGQKSLIFDRLQTTPKDNVEGIRTPKRQHSSRFDISDQRQRELEKLPGFQEVPPNKREELFMQSFKYLVLNSPVVSSLFYCRIVLLRRSLFLTIPPFDTCPWLSDL